MELAILTDLDRAGRELQADAAVRVVVLQSANPEFFIAHADSNVIAQLPETPPARGERLGWVHAVLDRFRTMPKATIAKIQGRCRGGGSELALACDMRFAEIGSGVFCQPEVGVGIIPRAGGSVRLPRLGRGRALPPGEIDFCVNCLAFRIAGFPAETVAMAKRAASIGEVGLEDELAREETIFLKSSHTESARRRMATTLAIGMQTPTIERCCFNHVWGPLAEQQS